MLSRFVLNRLFAVSRKDIANLLSEHEEELVIEFRKQLEILDRAIPDEEAFIDIRMAPLGETLLRGTIKALREFLERH